MAGPVPRGRRKAVGEASGGWGMIPFIPRDCGAGDRERVKVRRLSVPVRLWLALRPSELEAAGGGLGGGGGLRFDSPPLLRDSETLMEPRLPITVRVSSSVSSSSVLKPDAELTNASASVTNTPPYSLPRTATVRSGRSARIQTHETAFH
jgi:hypothetical protein